MIKTANLKVILTIVTLLFGINHSGANVISENYARENSVEFTNEDTSSCSESTPMYEVNSINLANNSNSGYRHLPGLFESWHVPVNTSTVYTSPSNGARIDFQLGLNNFNNWMTNGWPTNGVSSNITVSLIVNGHTFWRASTTNDNATSTHNWSVMGGASVISHPNPLSIVTSASAMNNHISLRLPAWLGRIHSVRFDFAKGDDDAQVRVSYLEGVLANRIPVARNDSFITVHDQNVSGNVLENNGSGVDVNGDGALIVVGNTTPVNGSVTLNPDGSFTYTPNSGFVGVDTFMYTIEDTDGDQHSAEVTINVTNGTNASDDQFQTVANTNLQGNVLTNDVDEEGDTQTVNTVPVQDVSHGTLTLNPDGTFTYIPDSNYMGEDTFEYEVCDNLTPAACATASVIIIIDEDSDFDGILDVIDIDDDNDGILDTDEESCIDQTQTSEFTWHGGSVSNVQASESTLGMTGVAWGNAYSDQVLSLPIHLEFTVSSISNGMLGLLPVSKTETSGWNDLGYKYQLSNNNAYIRHESTASGWQGAANGTVKTIDIDENGLVTFSIDGVVKKTYQGQVEDYKITISRGSFTANNVIVTSMRSAGCFVDEDGDGVPNRLDLDSDGDGCSDAYEGGATINNTADYIFTGNVGANGLVDTLETSVDSGEVNYTLTYGDFAMNSGLNACADTDGDGIGDLVDIDDDNDGILDVTELNCTEASPNDCAMVDTDGDGIPNHLDLDSDGDGCSDAYEGGATTDTTADFAFTGAVGTNGLADTLETSVDNGEINYSLTYQYAESADADACVDSDGDGIGDLADIDDDNDGVLDIDEGCNPGNLIENGDFSEENTGFSTDYTYTDGSVGTSQYRIAPYNTIIFNYNYGGSPNYPTAADPDGVIGNALFVNQGANTRMWYQTVTGLTPNTEYIFSHKIWTVRWSKWEVKVDGVQVGMFNENTIPSPQWNTYEVRFTTGTSQTSAVISLHNLMGTSEGQIILDDLTLKSTSNDGTCLSVDTDGDGIPNHLDLDSDGDGCSDAYEGGATTDTTADYQFTSAVGLNGLADTLETSVDSGEINYASTYYSYGLSSVLDACADSDGDGIGDLVDIDDDNDGIKDATESPSCYYTAEELEITNVTSSLTNYSTNTAYQFSELYDGVLNNVASYGANGTAIAGETIYEIALSFPVELEKIEVAYNYSIFQTAAVFKWQGFDGGNWVDLTGELAETQSTNNTKVYDLNATGVKYSRYRLLGVSGNTYYNRIYEITPELGNRFEASEHPRTTCDSDTDGDGILNHLDLDSDGDGCSDAYESGATTDTTADYQFASAVGTNGLADILETSVDGGEINYASTYQDFAVNSGLNACADTDGDGIGDLVDIDDDNDGILDIDELGCTLSLDISELSFTGNAVITTTENTLTTGSGGWRSSYSDQTYSLPIHFEFKRSNLSGSSMIGLIPVGANKTVSNWNDQSYKFYHSNGTTYGYFPTAWSFTHTSQADELYEIDIDANGVVTVKIGGVEKRTFNGTVSDYQIVLSQSSPITYADVLLTADNLSFSPNDCAIVDTDGDGVPNHLDLDSDGDGCSDAYEGGATTDTTADYQFTSAVGLNGLADTLETSVDSGEINYASTYYSYGLSSVLDACADSDGDGIGDLVDIDDDNDGIKDATESPSCYYTAEELEITNVTSSLTNYSTNTAYQFSELYDGVLNNVASYGANGTAITGETIYEIALSFPVELEKIEVAYNYSIFQTAAVFKWQGFDGGNWVDLTGELSETQSTNNTKVYDLNATGVKYSRYRLLGVSGNTYYNRIYEITPELGNRFEASEHPRTTCDTDTDGDGILNHLDLDSDGDGCSDAYESGATLNTTADYQFTSAVGTNGLADILETSVDGGEINYASTYQDFAVNSGLNACADTDGDGIGDLVDIDDDNDGILDIDELGCTLSLDISELSFTGNAVITTTENTLTTGSGGWRSSYSDQTYSLPIHFEFKRSNLSGSSMIGLIPVGANKTVSNWNDQSYKFYHSNGTTYGYFPTAWSFTHTSQADELYEIDIDVNGVVTVKIGGVEKRTFNGTVSDYQIVLSQSSPITYTDVLLTADNLSFSPNDCAIVDTDGDGVPNHLDLDSDGDGCSDAYEGGATTDKTTDFTFTGAVGANGLADTLETSVDNGEINYTSTYADYGTSDVLDLCLDTDGDGIGDIVDIDDDNDGILDTDEESCINQTQASEFTWHGGSVSNVQASENTLGMTGSAWGNAYSDQVLSLPIHLEFTVSSISNGMLGLIPVSKAETSGWNDLGYKYQLSNNNAYIRHESTASGWQGAANGTVKTIDIDENGLVTFSIDGVVKKIYQGQVEDYKITISRGSFTANNVIVTSMRSEGCFVDEDGDGIPNRLDLDSDGDGCFDAYEAGHELTVGGDGMVVDSFGANGLANSLEDNDTLNATTNYTVVGSQTGVADYLNNAVESEACQAAYNISGNVFDDNNASGIRDTDEGFIGVATLTLYADNNNDGVLDAGDTVITTTTTSTMSGNYSFTDVTVRNTIVAVTVPENTATFTYTLTTAGDQAVSSTTTDVTDVNFGIDRVQVINYNISGVVFDDDNENGSIDSAETRRLENVTLTLYADNNNDGRVGAGDTVIATTTSAADGTYNFANVTVATTLVEVTVPADTSTYVYRLTTGNELVTSSVNTDITGINFGINEETATYSISGTVFDDDNENGLNDSEGGLSNIPIRLYNDLNQNGRVDRGEPLLFETTTDRDGNYQFVGLTDVFVVIQAVVPPRTPTFQYTPTTPVSVGLSSGVSTTVDFGINRELVILYSISGLVWDDDNSNQIKDTAELVLSNINVTLYNDANANGVVDAGEATIATVPTSSTGTYTFTGINVLNVIVEPALPSNGTFTTASSLAFTSVNTDITNANFGIDIVSNLFQVTGVVFDDDNRNGIADPGEGSVDGLTVEIYVDTNGSGTFDPGLDALVAFTQTSNGAFDFANPNYVVNDVPTGQVFIRVVIPAGNPPLLTYTPTYDPDTGTANPDGVFPTIMTGDISGINFGIDVIDFIGTPRDVNGDTGLITNGENIQAIGEPVDVSSRLRLYPNPTVREIAINAEEFSGDVTVEVYNDRGYKIKSIIVNNVGNEIRVDVSELRSGMYYAKFISRNKVASKKFLKN